jgi:ribonuclease P protein component, eubacterial
MKRKNRVLKHQEFDEIISSTPVTKTAHYVVHWRPSQSQEARIGISVSKRNGGSVKRNRIKRQIRAMIAGGFDLSKKIDVIIIVKATYDPVLYHAEATELLGCLSTLGEPKIEKI